ncbi:hypothetical protein [Nonomuraea endophytica]|uniref:hypothetical protein n=1 Tax=Nonomuraea endophytica TaxID=714136 RepID=UPI0037C74AAA
MAEPVSLALQVGAALPEIIKFLLDRADKILDRGKGNDDQREQMLADMPSPPERMELEELCGDLRPALDLAPNEVVGNDILAHQADRLRKALEKIYAQHIVFPGEVYPQNKTMLTMDIDVKDVEHNLTGIRIHAVRNEVDQQVRIRADNIRGSLMGIDIDKLE